MCTSHGVETIRRVGSVGALLATVWMVSALPARADTMTWEMDGTLRGINGVFAQYLPSDAVVTLTLVGDADQPATTNPFCPPEANAAMFTVRPQLQVGDFTWTAPVAHIERHEDGGFCHNMGAALDLNSFSWSFVGTPPSPGLRFLSRVYADFGVPINEAAATLGEQLDAQHRVVSGFAQNPNGGFSFSGTFAPVPEPATCTLVGLGIVGLAARRRLTSRRQ